MAGLYGYSTASQAADQAFTSTLNTLDTLGQRRTNQAMQADIAGLKMPSFGADEGGDGRMGAINNALNYQQQMFEIGRKYGRPDLMSTASTNILTLQKDLTDYQRGLVTNKQADIKFGWEQQENARKQMEERFKREFREEASKIKLVDPLQYGTDEVARLRAELENAQTMLSTAWRKQQTDFVKAYSTYYGELWKAYNTALQNRDMVESSRSNVSPDTFNPVFGGAPAAPAAAPAAPAAVPGKANGGLVPKGYSDGGLVSYTAGSKPYYEPTLPSDPSQPQDDVRFYQQAAEFGRALQQLTAGGAPGGTVSGQAGLFDATPSGGLRPSAPPPLPPMPDLEGLVTSGSPLITQAPLGDTGVARDFAKAKAAGQLATAVKFATDKLSRASVAASPLGSLVGYFTTPENQVGSERSDAKAAAEARDWWQSSAIRYFRENPEAFTQEALDDPLKFYYEVVKVPKAVTSQLPADGATATTVEGGQGVGKGDLEYTPRMATAGNEAAALGISQAQYDALKEAVGFDGYSRLDAQALLDQGFVPVVDQAGGKADANAKTAAERNEDAIAKMVFSADGLKTYKAARDQLLAKAALSPQQRKVGLDTFDLTQATEELSVAKANIEQTRQAANVEMADIERQYKQKQRVLEAAYRANNATLATTTMAEINTLVEKARTRRAALMQADQDAVQAYSRTALTYAERLATQNPTNVLALEQIARARGAGFDTIQPMYGGTYLLTDSRGYQRQATLPEIASEIRRTFPADRELATNAAAEAAKMKFENDLKIAVENVKGFWDLKTAEQSAKLKAYFDAKYGGSMDVKTDPATNELVVIDKASGVAYPISGRTNEKGLLTLGSPRFWRQ